MLDFSRLISLKFIFNPALGSLSQAFAIFFYIFFGLIVILAIVSFFIKRKYQQQQNSAYTKLWQKIFDNALFFGISGFILLFFRQQRAYFLSMPFLWYLWGLYLIFEIYSIVYWAKTRLPKIMQAKQKKQELEKYL